MPPAFDSLRIIDAIYTECDADEWLKGVLHAAFPFGRGMPAAAATYNAHTGALGLVEAIDLDAEWVRSISALPFGRPVEFWWAVGLSRASERLSPGAGWRWLQGEYVRTTGYDDVHVLTATHRSGHGAFLSFGIDGAHAQVTPRARFELNLIAAHLTHIVPLKVASADTEGVATREAVLLDAEGHVLDGASGVSRSERDYLAWLCRRVARARLPSRRRIAPEEARATFDQLLSGNFALLQRIDRDGRRYLVARRHREGRDLRALTTIERAVLDGIASARSNKEIAYRLDVSVSTVASHIRAVMLKLGVTARGELIRLARSGGVGGA